MTEFRNPPVPCGAHRSSSSSQHLSRTPGESLLLRLSLLMAPLRTVTLLTLHLAYASFVAVETDPHVEAFLLLPKQTLHEEPDDVPSDELVEENCAQS